MMTILALMMYYIYTDISTLFDKIKYFILSNVQKSYNMIAR